MYLFFLVSHIISFQYIIFSLFFPTELAKNKISLLEFLQMRNIKWKQFSSASYDMLINNHSKRKTEADLILQAKVRSYKPQKCTFSNKSSTTGGFKQCEYFLFQILNIIKYSVEHQGIPTYQYKFFFIQRNNIWSMFRSFSGWCF